ncbi:MAG TPA: hypothetical protein VM364_20955 [Vicinamibacterales bacterium]|nr:hypothetical protein [Vicinamibacterales bacterium]
MKSYALLPLAIFVAAACSRSTPPPSPAQGIGVNHVVAHVDGIT